MARHIDVEITAAASEYIQKCAWGPEYAFWQRKAGSGLARQLNEKQGKVSPKIIKDSVDAGVMVARKLTQG